MIDRAIEEIRRLIPAGSRVMVALSGGADSTLLLRLCVMARYDVVAVHCNFHLRGDESLRDMNFCRDLCAKLDVPLDITHFDVPAFREESGMGAEEACRTLRYDRFNELLDDYGCSVIAVAHNADDNIETLMLNLLRGAGVSGLRGMLPIAGNIVRPLLPFSRRLILDMLFQLDQDFIVDSSNLSSDYRRNFLRNEILPMLRSRWPGLDKAIGNTIANLRSDERILNHFAYNILGVKSDEDLSITLLKDLPDPGWAIHRWAAPLGASSHIVREIAAAVEADRNMAGKQWNIRDGIIVASASSLSFIPKARLDDSADPTISDILNIEKFPNSSDTMNLIRRPGAPIALWLPFGPECCIIRHPLPGDRIDPIGMKGSQLVADILRDAHLSFICRKEIYLVAHRQSGEIIWIPEIKRSQHFLVKPSDPIVWRFRLIP